MTELVAGNLHLHLSEIMKDVRKFSADIVPVLALLINKQNILDFQNAFFSSSFVLCNVT